SGGRITSGLAVTLYTYCTVSPKQPLAEAITSYTAEPLTITELVSVCEGMVSKPLTKAPGFRLEVLTRFQPKLVPGRFPEKGTAAAGRPEQMVWESGVVVISGLG